MPVISAYISATVPAGLALYWVTMNIVSILQQLYINRRLANQSKNAIELLNSLPNSKAKPPRSQIEEVNTDR